jgi:hypothetical protein
MVTTVVPEKKPSKLAPISTERFALGALVTLGAGLAALAPVPAGPISAGAITLVAYLIGKRR